jgi:hypothetical protein
LESETLADALAQVLPPSWISRAAGFPTPELGATEWLRRARSEAVTNLPLVTERRIHQSVAAQLAATLRAEEGDRRIPATAVATTIVGLIGVAGEPTDSQRALVAELVARVELRGAYSEAGESELVRKALLDVNLPSRLTGVLVGIAANDESPFWAGLEVDEKAASAYEVLGI